MSGRRIVVSGTVCGVPGQGGAAWAVLQYVLGLRSLGHDVTLIEPVPDSGDPSVRADAEAITRDFGLEGRFGSGDRPLLGQLLETTRSDEVAGELPA